MLWVSRIRSTSTSLIIAVLSLSGCTQRFADLTVISTKNIYAKDVDISSLPQVHNVKGKSIAFLDIGTSLEAAIDEALADGQGNLMIDAVFSRFWMPFFYGWIVEGTVVQVPYTSSRTTEKEFREKWRTVKTPDGKYILEPIPQDSVPTEPPNQTKPPNE